MKKIYLMLGAAALLASCSTDDYTGWADPQANAADSTASIVFAATNAADIDFNNVTTDSIQLFVPTVKNDIGIVSQTLTADVTNGDDVTTLSANENGFIKASELQTAIESMYGKKETVHAVTINIKNIIKLSNSLGFTRTASVVDNINLVKPSFNDFFYEIGGESSWSASHALYSPESDGNYEGYYYLNGEFKFKSNADNWDDDYEYVSDGVISLNGASNIPDPGEGFYKINVNLGECTYSLTKVQSLSLIGTVHGTGVSSDDWSKDLDMTYDATSGAWIYTGTLSAGEFKIRLNHDWAIAWGGKTSGDDFANVTCNNGNNLKLTEDGNYTIKFSLSYEGNNKIEVTKN